MIDWETSNEVDGGCYCVRLRSLTRLFSRLKSLTVPSTKSKSGNQKKWQRDMHVI